MVRVLLVAAGGAIGSVARYYLSGIVQGAGTFPIGTFAVNMAGCLAIGLITGFAFERQQGLTVNARLFLMTGVCGGFTTFSAFGFETWQLIRDQHMLLALLNAGGQVVLGIVAVGVGIAIARMV